jgi:hypothetical protein
VMNMLTATNPLKVILSPPARLEGMPGEEVTLHVSLINQGDQGAVIDVFIDPAAQLISQWCASSRKRVALDAKQACEISVPFAIPLDALPGTYPFTVVVDAPEHYPEETPLHYPCELVVQVQDQPVERLEAPTFSLSPVTSPSKPLFIQPGQSHTLTITVNNHSHRVDRFRLTCPELDDHWFTVQYLCTDLAEVGLVSHIDGLELNPGSQGEIVVDLHYPVDMPAGHYSPTLQLISDNTPEQVHLDLVYLEVKPKYHLGVELETILGKASHAPGQYRLKLRNHGNLIRELSVGARTRDEVELCRYECEPPAVKLLIGETTEVSLTVYPQQKWRRPLIGFGQELPFQVQLEDLQSLPIPEDLPTGVFIWKARSWWQFLIFLLAGIGILSGLGIFIWLFFFKPSPPPVVTDYRSDSTAYTEGGKVRLNWAIANSDQLEQLVLTTFKEQTASTPQVYDFRRGMPSELSQFCQMRDRALTCTNVDTGARLVGKYNFQLQLKAKSAKSTAPPIQQDLNVVIKPKPLPQVNSIGARNSQLNKGQTLLLGWKISNFSQLDQLKVIGQIKGKKQTLLHTFDFKKQIPTVLKKQCQPPVNEVLTCSNVNIKLPAQSGDYEITLHPVALSRQAEIPPSKPIPVKVKAKPLEVLTFTLNGKGLERNPSIFLEVGQKVVLKWQVSGDDAKVKLEPLGDVPASGSKVLKATTGLTQVVLTAEAEGSQSIKRAFLVQVDTPQSPRNPTNNLLRPEENSSLFPKP